MAQTQVKAATIERMALRKPNDRPDLALLELHTKAGPQYYALNRDSLLKAADALRKHAETMPSGAADPA